jgi:hypothetical protein
MPVTTVSSTPPTQPGPEVPALELPGGLENTSSAPAGTHIQRAGIERGTIEPGEEIQQQNAPAPQTAQGPEPDLDALARQVYSLLKRRLGVEQRRDL